MYRALSGFGWLVRLCMSSSNTPPCYMAPSSFSGFPFLLRSPPCLRMMAFTVKGVSQLTLLLLLLPLLTFLLALLTLSPLARSHPPQVPVLLLDGFVAGLPFSASNSGPRGTTWSALLSPVCAMKPPPLEMGSSLSLRLRTPRVTTACSFGFRFVARSRWPKGKLAACCLGILLFGCSSYLLACCHQFRLFLFASGSDPCIGCRAFLRG